MKVINHLSPDLILFIDMEQKDIQNKYLFSHSQTHAPGPRYQALDTLSLCNLSRSVQKSSFVNLRMDGMENSKSIQKWSITTCPKIMVKWCIK